MTQYKARKRLIRPARGGFETLNIRIPLSFRSLCTMYENESLCFDQNASPLVNLRSEFSLFHYLRPRTVMQ
jgi:hypothetical protein